MPASSRGDASDASRALLEATIAAGAVEADATACRRALSEISERETRIWSGAVELVRAYQDELDALSRRARTSDAAFLSLYRALYAAPDPANALRRAGRDTIRCRELGAENAKLAAELRNYDGEFAQLKNQELTIRKLEDALRDAEREADSKAEERASQRATEAEREAEARVDAARERERALERRLQQAAHDKADLERELRERSDDSRGRPRPAPIRADADSSSTAPPPADDDGSLARAAAAEHEVAVLRAVLRKYEQRPAAADKRRLSEVEAECSEVRAALTDARREAGSLRDERAELGRRIEMLERGVQDERRGRESAEAARFLAENERRELEALRRVLDDDGDVEAAASADDPERTVDSRLCGHLRRARDEAATLRARLSNAHAERDAALAKLDEARTRPRPPRANLPVVERPDDYDASVIERQRLFQRCQKLEADLAAARDAARRDRTARDELARDHARLRDKCRTASRRSTQDPEDPDYAADAPSSLDPLAQLESKAAKNKPALVDKLALPLLRHAKARRVAVIYVATLHFLVFAATFHVSHSDKCPARGDD